MPLNHYVTLGHSGLRVSPLCLGAMTFGEDLGWGTSVKDADAMLDRYIELGGNFIDTANGYTFGHSETIIGDHLGKDPSKRDRLVIASKFFFNLYPGDPNGGGTGRKAMIAACEQSLRRLQTDYLDLYWMHCWDQHTPIEETMRGLDDLVRAGKIRYAGFSDTPAWKVAQAQLLATFKGWAPLIALQIEYSLLERTVEGELVPMAKEMGLGITPWSPLKGGLLSGKYQRDQKEKADSKRGWVAGGLNEKSYAVIDEVTKIAKAHDTSPASVALAWVNTRPGVASSIIGARNVEQMEQNIGALEVKLTEAEVESLNKVSTPTLNFPAGFLTQTPSIMHGGISVNGITPAASSFVPKPGSKIW